MATTLLGIPLSYADGYPLSTGHFDEAFALRQELRAHWAEVMSAPVQHPPGRAARARPAGLA